MDDAVFKVEAAAETALIPVEWAQFRDGYQTGICYQRATQPDHPLLIFLHDSRWYGQQFDPLFPRLVDYGNLLAPNLRCHGPLAAHRGEIDYIGQFEDDIADLIFQKSGLKPPTSVGKNPTVRRRRSKPLHPSTLVGGGSVQITRANASMFAVFECQTKAIKGDGNRPRGPMSIRDIFH